MTARTTSTTTNGTRATCTTRGRRGHDPLPDVSKIAVIYKRVSDTKQERDGTSLETQEEYSRKYCEEQGYTVLAVEQDVHTGGDMEDPGIWRAMDYFREHRAGVFVA